MSPSSPLKRMAYRSIPSPRMIPPRDSRAKYQSNARCRLVRPSSAGASKLKEVAKLENEAVRSSTMTTQPPLTLASISRSMTSIQSSGFPLMSRSSMTIKCCPSQTEIAWTLLLPSRAIASIRFRASSISDPTDRYHGRFSTSGAAQMN